MKKEVKKIIKGQENDLVIARQCCNHLGFSCYIKDCKNYCCPLNCQYSKLKYKKKR
jgi:hypothetical protein